jgi:hypothetical protein
VRVEVGREGGREREMEGRQGGEIDDTNHMNSYWTDSTSWESHRMPGRFGRFLERREGR